MNNHRVDPDGPDDQDTVDRIATLLGTAETWPGADFLEYIADLIGQVRPHPGGDPNGYEENFERATGRPVDPSWNQNT